MGKVSSIVKVCLLKPWALLLAILFYKPQYLKGKFFGKGMTRGWYWVLRCFFMQKIIGINRNVPFPVTFTSRIPNWKNIYFDNDNMNIFQKTGLYLQAIDAKIEIGSNCEIANNVGIITANHDINNPHVHSEAKNVVLGNDTWIGFNAVILPGVILGPHTVVGAGSIVTKSFPDGYCVIAGNPARVIRTLERNEHEFTSNNSTHGNCVDS